MVERVKQIKTSLFSNVIITNPLSWCEFVALVRRRCDTMTFGCSDRGHEVKTNPHKTKNRLVVTLFYLDLLLYFRTWHCAANVNWLAFARAAPCVAHTGLPAKAIRRQRATAHYSQRHRQDHLSLSWCSGEESWHPAEVLIALHSHMLCSWNPQQSSRENKEEHLNPLGCRLDS